MTKPLLNKKVLITREKNQAKKFADLIRQRGGMPFIVPLIEIVSLPILTKWREENDYEWLVFTSANGVHCFMNQIENKAKLKEYRFAAVGSKTALAIEQYGLTVSFIPSTYNAKTMVSEFIEQYPKANNLLLVRGNLSSNVLVESFEKETIQFESIIVYETRANLKMKKNLIHILQHEDVDILTFTSPSIINTFVTLLEDTALLEEMRHLPAVSIGTTTEQAASKHRFKTLITPEKFTIESMLSELEKYIEITK